MTTKLTFEIFQQDPCRSGASGVDNGGGGGGSAEELAAMVGAMSSCVYR